MASGFDILLDSLGFSLLLSLIVSLIQLINPGLELHNYPKELSGKVQRL